MRTTEPATRYTPVLLVTRKAEAVKEARARLKCIVKALSDDDDDDDDKLK